MAPLVQVPATQPDHASSHPAGPHPFAAPRSRWAPSCPAAPACALQHPAQTRSAEKAWEQPATSNSQPVSRGSLCGCSAAMTNTSWPKSTLPIQWKPRQDTPPAAAHQPPTTPTRVWSLARLSSVARPLSVLSCALRLATWAGWGRGSFYVRVPGQQAGAGEQNMLTKQQWSSRLRQCGPAPPSTRQRPQLPANSASRPQATYRYACSVSTPHRSAHPPGWPAP